MRRIVWLVVFGLLAIPVFAANETFTDVPVSRCELLEKSGG